MRTTKLKNVLTANYDRLVNEIGSLMAEARIQVSSTVNTILVKTYWAIGRHIVEYEQNGSERADYGKPPIKDDLIF